MFNLENWYQTNKWKNMKKFGSGSAQLSWSSNFIAFRMFLSVFFLKLERDFSSQAQCNLIKVNIDCNILSNEKRASKKSVILLWFLWMQCYLFAEKKDEEKFAMGLTGRKQQSVVVKYNLRYVYIAACESDRTNIHIMLCIICQKWYSIY